MARESPRLALVPHRGAGIACFLLTIALLTRAAAASRRSVGLILAGASKAGDRIWVLTTNDQLEDSPSTFIIEALTAFRDT